MPQPPSAVPSVSARAQTTGVHKGAVSDSRRPSATSRAAITPTDFCASLAPWLKASEADIAHSPPAVGRRQRRVARRAEDRSPRIASRAAAAPSRGATARAPSVPSTPTGWPRSNPPHWIASAPPATSAAPTRPPTSAWPELDGSPSAQVATFQSSAASSPAPITSTPVAPPTVTMPPIVSATALPTTSGPSRLKTAAISTACSGRAARVATSAAIAFDASWIPLVNANSTASTRATARATSTRAHRRRSGEGSGAR